MTAWEWAGVAVAFVVAAQLARRFSQPGSRFHWLDHPNERSLHTRPMPRTGGVALIAGLLVGLAVVWGVSGGIEPDALGVLAGAGLIAAVSFIDDRRGVPVRIRFPGHVIGAALAMVAAGLGDVELLPGMLAWLPPWVTLGLILVFLVWMVNLYNFMDGIDGLAGGMAVFGFGTLAVLGLVAGAQPFAVFSALCAAAAGGFLLINFPPARIFMGDTGSATLGLLAGALSLWGARDGIFPFWAALLVFSPFLVDASVTLFRRTLAGERVWQAHKTHYYQRLVQLGWEHKKTVLCEYALMAACGVSALVAVRLSPSGQFALLVAWFLIYTALIAGAHHLEKKKRS